MLQDSGYRIGRFGKGVWPSKHQFRKRDSFGKRYKSFDKFLENRKPGEPFCYWHGGQDPHRPYEVGIGAKSGISLEKIPVPPIFPDHSTVRSDIADYYWEVQRFDREVGSILARLKAIGELDNTIVVVTSDNGMPFPRCKATLYDQGTRVPLAIRWGTRVQPARRVSDFVSLCDLAPTFLTAAGLKPDKRMTGQSLISQLESHASGQIDKSRRFVLCGVEKHVYLNPRRAIRSDRFLYIRNFEPSKWRTGVVVGQNPKHDFATTPWPTGPGAFSFNIDPSPTKQFLRLRGNKDAFQAIASQSLSTPPREELFDLKADPHQVHDVAADPKYAGELKRLSGQLAAELKGARDPRFPK